MPLLISPIDGSPMRQVHRYGIEIDVCPTSGGIWLDKGELEKMMALLREEALNDQPVSQTYGRKISHGHGGEEDDYQDDDDDDRFNRGHGKKGRRSRMMDIFDF